MRPKRAPDFRVNVECNGYVLSHSFNAYSDASKAYEALRVSALLDPIGNVQLVNEREQRVLRQALDETK